MSGRERGAASAGFIATVGRQIRQRRQEQGWTVQELSDRSGVSRRMLTQIELGQANPSLVTVDRIAHALDSDFASLALPSPIPAAAGSSREALRVWSSAGGSEAALLTATDHVPRAELWHWRLAPGDTYQAEPDASGTEELHYVHAGELTITTGGAILRVRAGEAGRIRSDQHYAYHNDGPSWTEFTRVVVGA
ncbi:helix-turn-helix domain-containing protein [Arthrobacter mobilis]|uniref:Helix-turn-helix domain-containing protein n=1 Tax=Arthrobacter mobilis TaxID=2724944 RepID=A0A7X6HCJ7_9MICC|nr:XRE family transcriptional regulator [Arthrobacter mobilis]NKX54496.1 helix-turn-helix domain-containing protein [Arthrobacter mobilis]